FLIVGGSLAALGWAVRDGLPDVVAKAKADEAAKKVEQPALASSKDAVLGELPLDPLELSIGFGLVPLVDRRGGGTLISRVSAIRRQIAGELGIVIPAVRIHDE